MGVAEYKEIAMILRLPDELRTQVIAHPVAPVEIIDEETRMVYVLVPADEFKRMKTAVEDELSETYPAQVESAMEAGWNDIAMDDYNDYDSHRQMS
jgi:hypothetical protein